MKTFHSNLVLCLVCLLAQRGLTQASVASNGGDEHNYGFFEGMIRHIFKMERDNIDQNTAFWETFIHNYNKTISGILHSDFDLQDELSKLQNDIKELIAVSNSTDLFFIKAIALARQTAAVSGDALQVFNSLATIVTDFTAGVRTAVILLLDALSRNFNNLEAMVKYPPTAVYLKIVQVYRAVIKQLTGVLAAVNNEVKNLASSIVTDIKVAGEITAEIKKILTAAAERIVMVLEKVIYGVAQVVADMAVLPQWTVEAMGTVISQLENVAQSAVEVIASIAEALTAPIRNVISKIQQIGYTVMYGIGSAVGNVVKTAVSVPFAILRG